MKKGILLVLKILLLILLLGGLLLGFSFLTGGWLANRVGLWMGLPVHEEVPPPGRSAVPAENDWMAIEEETQNGIEEPDRDLLVHSAVFGDVTGRNVDVKQEGRITGNVRASDTIRIEGGVVRGDVRAPRVIAEFDEWRFEGPPDQWRKAGERTEITGNVDGEHIVIGRETAVTGRVGNKNARVEVAGHVRGDVAGQQIVLRSTAVVEGNVHPFGNAVVMEPGAEVRGQFVTEKGQPLRVIKQESPEAPDKWAPFPGPERREHFVPPPRVEDRDHRDFPGPELAFAWIPLLIGILSMALLARAFAGREVERSLEHATATPWKSLWMGVLTFLVGLPLIFLLTISVIGIPVVLIILIALTAAAWIGLTGLAVKTGSVVGTSLNLSGKKEWMATVLGTVLLAHLIWVPVIGWLTFTILSLIGIGSVMLHWVPRFRDSWRDWRNSRREKHKDENQENGQ